MSRTKGKVIGNRRFPISFKTSNKIKTGIRKYKKYDGISTILEEMLIDYALTKMLDTNDIHIETELKDLKEIMNNKCTNSLFLKYVESEMPNLPKAIEKLIHFNS